MGRTWTKSGDENYEPLAETTEAETDSTNNDAMVEEMKENDKKNAPATKPLSGEYPTTSGATGLPPQDDEESA